MRRCVSLLVLAVTVGVLAHPSAQTPPQDPAPQNPQVFRSGADTVVVPATVTDIGGRFVRNLTREDFVVRDNGKLQEITVFNREYQTVSAVVLLDASSSMIPALDRVISAANDFIVRLMPGDQARIGSFSEEVRISSDFTGDRDALLAEFENEFNVRIGRRTRLWDSMYQAVERLSSVVEGRRVIIVVTDGVDSWSTHTYDDVLGAVRRHNVAVFVVRVNHANWRQSQAMEFSRGPDGSSPGIRSIEPNNAIDTMTRDTGGGFIDVDATWAHQAPFTDIMLDLHSAYFIGFTPEVLDNRVHELSVEVRRRGLSVKARRSYIASPSRTASGGRP